MVAVERRLGPAEFRWDAWDMGRRALRVCLSRIWKLPDPTRGGLLSRPGCASAAVYGQVARMRAAGCCQFAPSLAASSALRDRSSGDRALVAGALLVTWTGGLALC